MFAKFWLCRLGHLHGIAQFIFCPMYLVYSFNLLIYSLCVQVDFVNIQARSDAERRRADERQRRLQLAQTQKLNQVTQEMNGKYMLTDIQPLAMQVQNQAFDLVKRELFRYGLHCISIKYSLLAC